jgi:nitrogen regulatory protein P-II 1
MALKLVTAIIQPDKLDEVRSALIEAEIYRISVSRCTGRGRAEDTDLYRGEKVALDLLPKVRIDIACSSQDWADRAIQAILSAAKHNGGEIGDGKIFVTELEQCIRIRTGETGTDAI